ncbi:MAG TPA: sugar porter family MFS transporter [Bacteroidia bacterium]|nr:sugar porter family MFS transporter [Bacteroidia bacterium]
MNKLLLKCTIAAALGGLLFGYDTVIINGAMIELIRHFNLTPSQQGWTVSSALIGCILGTFLVSKPADKYGAKLILELLALIFFISSLGCGLSANISTFIIFRLIGGLAIGGASVLCPVYISEISPPKHRGLLTSTFQLAIVLGILLSLLTNYLLVNFGENNWRWMLISGTLPAIFFFLLLLSVKNSPRWLVKKGKIQEATRTIEELSSSELDSDFTINQIQESIQLEVKGNRINLFKKPFKRITFIGINVGIISQLTGIGIVFYYSSQIFSIAGFSNDSSLGQSVILGVTNLIFTILAMLIIDKVGRKKLLLIGQIGMFLMLGTFGFGLVFGKIGGYWLVLLLVSYIAFFAASQGVVVWVLLSEMIPNIIRARGVSMGSLANWVISTILNLFFPIVIGLFGASQASQKIGLGYAFLFLSITTLIGFVYLRINIIETKGKTLELIEKEYMHDKVQ